MSALPIFPVRLQTSIFGRSELNFRVRNGNGWTLALISTDFFIATDLRQKQTIWFSISQRHWRSDLGDPYRIRTDVKGVRGLCLNHLTNGPFFRLYPENRTKRIVHRKAYCLQIVGQALGLLVPVSSIHYCTSTSGLSNKSSACALTSYE